jgi:hypothetical protein
MKKCLIVLMVLVLSLSAATGARAAGFPASATAFKLTAGGNDFYVVLSVKLSGAVKMAGGPVKFYRLSGSFINPNPPGAYTVPLSGAGYLYQNKLILTLSGSMFVSGLPVFFNLEGILDKANSGAQGIYFRGSHIWGDASPYVVTQVSPKTVPRP